MTVWSRPDQAERFIREYADPILRVCAAYSLGRADAQDICQDIFLTLLEREQAFQGPEHERAFILRCAINACKDLLKSFFRSRTVPLEEAPDLPAQDPAGGREVLGAVLSLPQRYRDVIYLHYYEGYSAVEIGKLLSKNVNSIYTLLHRAKALLREDLGGDELE